MYGSTAILDLGPFFSLLISPSQGRYLHTDNHASSVIRTHDPSVLVGEDSLCFSAATVNGHVNTDKRLIL
jgi:hypothetical protein